MAAYINQELDSRNEHSGGSPEPIRPELPIPVPTEPSLELPSAHPAENPDSNELIPLPLPPSGQAENYLENVQADQIVIAEPDPSSITEATPAGLQKAQNAIVEEVEKRVEKADPGELDQLLSWLAQSTTGDDETNQEAA